MTMTETPARSGTDPEVLVLAGAVRGFTDAGLDVFVRLQAGLDVYTGLEEQVRARGQARTDVEAEVARRLAAGDLDVDGAAVELAAMAVPGLDETVQRALRDLRRRLQNDAAREALGAFDKLAALCAVAVAEAVAAGRACVDMPAVVAAFDGIDYRLQVPALVAGAPVRPEWPAAVAATERVRELRALADRLVRVGGPPARFWSGKRPIGIEGIVDELVPEPLIMAVGDALGWRPGLVVAAGPQRGFDPGVGDGEARARQAAVEGAMRAAPLQRVVDRIAGRH